MGGKEMKLEEGNKVRTIYNDSPVFGVDVGTVGVVKTIFDNQIDILFEGCGKRTQFIFVDMVDKYLELISNA